MSIILEEDVIRAAHIKQISQAKPSVEWIASYPSQKTSGDKVLEKLGKELHSNNYLCTTLLGGKEYQLLSVEAPNVPSEELKTAIRWRLKDMLDFRVDEATIDVFDVPIDKDAPSRNHTMYAVAARNQLIEKRQTLFADAKIALKAIDIPDLAQRNISALLEPPGRGIAMLFFDKDGGLLTVTYGTELYLSRRIDVTLMQLSNASGDDRISLFDKITLELQRSLDHFDRQFHFITLSKLMLGPLGEAAQGLQEYLGSNLYLPVDTFTLDAVLDLAKVPDLRNIDAQQCYFYTLGAALRVEEKVL